MVDRFVQGDRYLHESKNRVEVKHGWGGCKRFLGRACGGLRIRVSEQGSTSTVSLEGEWDLAGKPAIHQAVGQALKRRPECLGLDLSRLSFIDSSGVHIALELVKRSVAQNFRLVIFPGPRAVQWVFEICQLTEFLPFTQASSLSA